MQNGKVPGAQRGGASTPTAAAIRPIWTRSNGPGAGVELGAGEILLTSMDRDGTQTGYDLELTRRVGEAVEVPVIASGGAGRMEHFAEVLSAGSASAALAASLFHFGTFTIPQVKEFLSARGVPVRR